MVRRRYLTRKNRKRRSSRRVASRRFRGGGDCRKCGSWYHSTSECRAEEEEEEERKRWAREREEEEEKEKNRWEALTPEQQAQELAAKEAAAEAAKEARRIAKEEEERKRREDMERRRKHNENMVAAQKVALTKLLEQKEIWKKTNPISMTLEELNNLMEEIRESYAKLTNGYYDGYYARPKEYYAALVDLIKVIDNSNEPNQEEKLMTIEDIIQRTYYLANRAMEDLLNYYMKTNIIEDLLKKSRSPRYIKWRLSVIHKFMYINNNYYSPDFYLKLFEEEKINGQTPRAYLDDLIVAEKNPEKKNYYKQVKYILLSMGVQPKLWLGRLAIPEDAPYLTPRWRIKLGIGTPDDKDKKGKGWLDYRIFPLHDDKLRLSNFLNLPK